MSTQKKITKKDVLHLADLSQLTLTESEIDDITQKLEETVEYIENIGEVDTKGYEGAYHSTENVNVYREDTVDELRQFDQATAMRNSSGTKKNMFVVNRIME